MRTRVTLVSSIEAALLSLLVPLALHAQSLAHNPVPPRDARGGTVVSAVAVRAPAPPTIDGKDDDAIWRTAPEIAAFQQFSPSSGSAASSARPRTS